MSDQAAVTLQVRPAARGGDNPPVSVITPLPAGAALPDALFGRLPQEFEIIVAAGGTRAGAMNAAAARAAGAYLWFVHADTVVSVAAVARAQAAAALLREQIDYCDLRFDGGGLMRLTDWGVLFRSRVLGLPFGDQALGMPAALFQRLGGYREDAASGEDHLLVWRAHQLGVPVRPLGAAIGTSALKYREKGWLRMTARHLWLTWRQAWPEWRAMRAARRLRAKAHAEHGRPGRQRGLPDVN